MNTVPGVKGNKLFSSPLKLRQSEQKCLAHIKLTPKIVVQTLWLIMGSISGE
jgi:hypothetical protein